MQSNTYHLESSMKTVKRIVRQHFELRLVETTSGQYRVCWEVSGKPHIGEPISDYTLASKIFDLKLLELEGH